MNDMTGSVHPDSAGPVRSTNVAGSLILALSLACGVPLLVAAYGLYASTLASDPGRPAHDWTLSIILLLVTGGSAAAGAVMLWRLARAVRRGEAAAAPTGSPALDGPAGVATGFGSPPRASEKDTGAEDVAHLMDSLSRVLGTIEEQAADIDRCALRLDSAYKEIETSNARLKEFSFKDEVTGLYNRRFFSIRLEEEVSRYRRFNHPVSVVLLDLDGFKAINDELGHVAGDETLRGVAETLLKHSRGINVICRYGGDEFAVLLVETSKAGAWLYADRIRSMLPNRRFNHGRQITASFGIASLPEDVAPSPDELIRGADEALYSAKRAGKNRVSVRGEMTLAQPSTGESPTG
jgi:diguanylate cyclase (GGDEF)-like protein